MRLSHLSAMLGSLAASVAIATPIVVPNPSFEAASGFWAATDWTNAAVGSDGNVEILTGAFTGKDGNNFLNLTVTGSNGTPPLSVSSIFSADLGEFQPNMTYTLTVGVGHNYDWNPSDVMSAQIGLATSSTLASIVGTNSYSLRNDGGTTELTYNALIDKTVVFTTGAAGGPIGQNLHVVLQFTHDGQYYRSARFDNVRLDASPVPEPAFLGLLASGAMLTLGRRRRNA